jgi:HK97 gp10 family phage protein
MAAKATVTFDDRAFQAGLKRALGQLAVRTEQDLVTLGFRVQNGARARCPVDTGRLRASIISSGLRHDGGGAYVEVGTNVFYGGFVEFGTRRNPAQPYLRPALLEAASTWGR